MKKKGILLCLVLLICLALSVSLAETKEFTRGKQLELFNENGVKAYLTGEVSDDGFGALMLKAVIENNTDHGIGVSYTGTGNGWNISTSYFGDGGENINAHAKAKTYLRLDYEALDIKRFSDLESIEVTFAVEEPSDFLSIGKTATYFTVGPMTISFGGGGEPVRELTYYEESPSLPVPTSYSDVTESGSGSSRVNGKLTSIRYTYRPMSMADTAKQMMEDYREGLKAAGYAVSGTGNSFTVSVGGKKLATVTLSGNTFQMEIAPGNEKLKTTPSSQNVASVAPAAKTYKIGDTLKAGDITMTLEKSGSADKINSYLDKQPSTWRYLEAQSGNTLFFIRGQFTNNGSRSVDIERLYLEASFDGGSSIYDGQACALRTDGQTFDNDVSSKSKAAYYVFFEVPKSVASNYKKCTVRIGVTNDFGIKIRKNDGYNFDLCDYVFDVELEKGSRSIAVGVSSNKSTPASTAKPSGQTTTVSTSAVVASTKKSSSSSDDAGSSPITFQNIPWGSSPEQTRKGIASAKLIKSAGSMSRWDGGTQSMLFNPEVGFTLSQYYTKVICEDYVLSQKITGKIAGYSIGTISACYAYEVKNGKLNKRSPKLISVFVELETPDEDAAMEDLEKKLTKLYGKPKKTRNLTYIFQGADDTAVVLMNFFSPSLLYAKTDNLELVQGMYDELGYTIDSDDMSGL